MVKNELIEASPVRVLDGVTSGGLKAGQMGIVTSKKGLGKTSVLVQLALDALIKGKKVVHVSFDQHSSNVISWYNSVLAEIAKKRNLSDAAGLADDIMRERTILNFNQETFTMSKVVKTIKALQDGGINIEAIIIDGADMKKVKLDELKEIAAFVRENNMTAWFSETSETSELSKTLEKDALELFAIVVHLKGDANATSLTVLKAGSGDEGKAVRLDQKTQLIAK